MRTKKINLLHPKDVDMGHLLRMNIDIDKLLLAGIVEIKLSWDFGEELRSEFFTDFDTKEFMPDDKIIMRYIKRNQKEGLANPVSTKANKLAKDFQ